MKNTITNLVKSHGTPLFVIQREKLIEQVKKFTQLMPRIQPYYAVKANPNLEIIKVFHGLNLGFDVASQNEIESVLKLGAQPEKLIFANTNKDPRVLQYAHKNKIPLMTFDSEYELNKIAKYAPGSKVLVRIKVPNVGSMVELSIKFGVEASDAVPLLIKAYKLGLIPAGVSFHVGSQCLKVENYIEAFELASIIFNDANLKQLPLEILDVGGGFPIKHFDNEEDSFEQMAPMIEKELNRLFDSNIKVIAEPGRVLVGPSCTLITQVIGKSIRANKHWYYLNDGVYGTLSGIIFDHCKYQYKALRRGPTQISTLAGPTCDSLDVISFSEDLPELEFGDIIFVENIGAYSIATATNFNSLPVAKTITI